MKIAARGDARQHQGAAVYKPPVQTAVWGPPLLGQAAAILLPRKRWFFRGALKLANANGFPAFFAPLCSRVGHGMEHGTDACFWP